jgi:hypothetical protein
MPIVVGNGIDIGSGITITSGAGGGGGTPGVDNVLGYFQLDPPITPGNQLEDPTATVNSPTGFTINNQSLTGIAFPALTVSNQNWVSNNFATLPGNYTCTWGPGSTVASSTIMVVSVSPLTFFVQGQTGAATYNYPFVLSV